MADPTRASLLVTVHVDVVQVLGFVPEAGGRRGLFQIDEISIMALEADLVRLLVRSRIDLRRRAFGEEAFVLATMDPVTEGTGSVRHGIMDALGSLQLFPDVGELSSAGEFELLLMAGLAQVGRFLLEEMGSVACMRIVAGRAGPLGRQGAML